MSPARVAPGGFVPSLAQGAARRRLAMKDSRTYASLAQL